MEIFLAGEGDVLELVRLFHQLTKRYEDDPDAVGMALRHQSTDVLIAVEAGRILGTATVSSRAVPSFGLVAYVDDVVVDEKSRGRGVAQALMEHIKTRALQRGHRGIELTSRPEREEANELYKGLGYNLRDTNKYFLRLDEEY
ncbi:MAG: GNAT family N-acetyltransferase [Patescibacteria group bacterium]|nr:GNAT family N-acetyltransferase [Patescibacteria group bacterium]